MTTTPPEAQPQENGTKSQTQEIYEWLQQGRAIDPMLALERFGVFRLSGRILELRQAGHPITTTIIEKNNKRFASYTLEK